MLEFIRNKLKTWCRLMHIKKAQIKDLNSIMRIYSIAQDEMIKSRNPTQWGHNYPSEELIKEDIKNKVCHVICEGNTIHGVFALLSGCEPTYTIITNGNWLNDDEYLTIHRIASDAEVKGIFKCVINYCKSLSSNIRIDTHENNKIMQHLIEKNGFVKCGKIFVRDGSPRIAYQWSQKIDDEYDS